MKNLLLYKCSVNEALDVWKKSRYKSIFTNPLFLEKVSVSVDWHLVKKISNNRNYVIDLCLWPICKNEYDQVYLPPFCYYVGPLWTEFEHTIPNHRKLSFQSSVYEIFLSEFEKQYNQFTSCLPIGLNDVRIFDWWNYHNKNKNRIKISPRYTATINLKEKYDDIMNKYRKVRRYEINKVSKSKNFFIDKKVKLNEIINLYNETFQRQNTLPSTDYIENIKKIYALSNLESVEIIAVRDSNDNDKPKFVAIVLTSNLTSNLILTSTANNYRNSGISAFGIDFLIKSAIDRNDNIFDFNGANSPFRGDDKHSYGAKASLYFEIDFKK